ncbi:MAG: fumarylacetoacetate hydrolase family protein [Ferroplasma sp.]
MKITSIIIENKRHLALYNNGKFALLEDYGINKNAIMDLSESDLNSMENIKGFKEYDFKFESLIDQRSTLHCIGLNYKSHVQEHGNQKVPDVPLVFSKSNNTFTGNNSNVVAEEGMQVDYEGELAVMIGKDARNVDEANALDYVYGYFIGNDVSSRLMQYKTSQFYLGKTFDKFYPNGPYLAVNEIEDPQALTIKTTVNGELRQNSSTDYMIFNVKHLISYISQFLTLRKGDCISTGTPSGVVLGMPENSKKWLKAGDTVQVEISGLGKLKTSFI